VRVLISDNSVLVNLRNGGLLETAFGLPWTFAVPDLLADAEIYPQELRQLSALGLQVVELDPNGITAAQQLQANKRRLSLVDCFSLTLAEIDGWCLQSGPPTPKDSSSGWGGHAWFPLGCRGDGRTPTPR
jgi:hypothetical protein